MSRAPEAETQAHKVAKRLAAELEAILTSSKINREKLEKLWLKIEDLDAAIQSSQAAKVESERKHQPENRAS